MWILEAVLGFFFPVSNSDFFSSDLIQFVFVSLSRSLVSYYLKTLVVIVSKVYPLPLFPLGCSFLLFHIKHIPRRAQNQIYWQPFWKAGGWFILLQAIKRKAFFPLQTSGVVWNGTQKSLAVPCLY